MIVLIKRNLKLFFRDKTAVLFSLLAIVIIVLLYAVFLGDVWLDGNMKGVADANVLMRFWLVAGLLSVASVTTTLGAFGVMIDDKVREIDKDFYSAPIKKSGIIGGYIGSACIIGVVMSLLTALAAEVYLIGKGEDWITPLVFVKVVLLVLLTTVMNTSIVCFLVSFLKSHSAFTTAGTIIGTLIGFLTGIYLPIGALPPWVQIVIKVFPVSHAASLFRQVLMEDTMQRTFAHFPVNELNQFKEYMGVTFRFGSFVVPPWMSVLVLVVTAVVFYGLSFLNMSRRR